MWVTGGDAMWRFIVVTFGFLGVAFYQLSGGADYQPREGSRQHAALNQSQLQSPTLAAPQVNDKPVIVQRNPQRQVQTAGSGNARVVLASARAKADSTDKRIRLTLNSGARAATGESPDLATVTVDPEKIARLVAAATTEARAPAKPKAEPTADRNPGQEIRRVKPARVNMRAGPGTDYDVLDKLTQGTEVAILFDNGDGWVELRVLDSGQQGWIADYLLVAAN